MVQQGTEQMSKFIDVYVLPVPKDRLDDYRRLAEDMGRVWRKLGALGACLSSGLHVGGESDSVGP
jgi:uncharacterized protein YbaA (DUF1428 family)